MANYAVDSSFLTKYLPWKTEIDTWNGICYVSLVGFMFWKTRLKGRKIPFHSDFEEINLRFYVTYNDNGERKRGVVFIKEIVPKPALTLVANAVYKEKYQTMRTRHSWETSAVSLTVEYAWRKKQWHSLKVFADKNASPIQPGSEEEFITEHYWGYTKIGATITSQYQVEHPKWLIYPTRDYSIDVDFGDVYGEEFAFLRNEKPLSVFLAEGSEITVRSGRRI